MSTLLLTQLRLSKLGKPRIRVAADAAAVVSGLVLLNSAGKIDPSYQPGDEVDLQASSSVPPRLLVELFSRGLFLCATLQSRTCRDFQYCNILNSHSSDIE